MRKIFYKKIVRSCVSLVIPFYFSITCLGVDNAKVQESVLFLKLSAALVAYSSNPSFYTGDNPVYIVSEKEIQSISQYETTLAEMKWLEEKAIEESVQEFNEVFYYQKRTDAEIEADVLDWDLGLPTENRKLQGDARENKKSENLALLKDFFKKTQSQISTLSEEDLRVIRINSLLSVSSFQILKPYLEKNPEIDKSIFEITIRNHVKTRELVIDEMIKRRIDL